MTEIFGFRVDYDGEKDTLYLTSVRGDVLSGFKIEKVSRYRFGDLQEALCNKFNCDSSDIYHALCHAIDLRDGAIKFWAEMDDLRRAVENGRAEISVIRRYKDRWVQTKEAKKRVRNWQKKVASISPRWKNIVPLEVGFDQTMWERRRRVLVAYEGGAKLSEIGKFLKVSTGEVRRLCQSARRESDHPSPVEIYMNNTMDMVILGTRDLRRVLPKRQAKAREQELSANLSI